MPHDQIFNKDAAEQAIKNLSSNPSLFTFNKKLSKLLDTLSTSPALSTTDLSQLIFEPLNPSFAMLVCQKGNLDHKLRLIKLLHRTWNSLPNDEQKIFLTKLLELLKSHHEMLLTNSSGNELCLSFFDLLKVIAQADFTNFMTQLNSTFAQNARSYCHPFTDVLQKNHNKKSYIAKPYFDFIECLFGIALQTNSDLDGCFSLIIFDRNTLGNRDIAASLLDTFTNIISRNQHFERRFAEALLNHIKEHVTRHPTYFINDIDFWVNRRPPELSTTVASNASKFLQLIADNVELNESNVSLLIDKVMRPVFNIAIDAEMPQSTFDEIITTFCRLTEHTNMSQIEHCGEVWKKILNTKTRLYRPQEPARISLAAHLQTGSGNKKMIPCLAQLLLTELSSLKNINPFTNTVDGISATSSYFHTFSTVLLLTSAIFYRPTNPKTPSIQFEDVNNTIARVQNMLRVEISRIYEDSNVYGVTLRPVDAINLAKCMIGIFGNTFFLGETITKGMQYLIWNLASNKAKILDYIETLPESDQLLILNQIFSHTNIMGAVFSHQTGSSRPNIDTGNLGRAHKIRAQLLLNINERESTHQPTTYPTCQTFSHLGTDLEKSQSQKGQPYPRAIDSDEGSSGTNNNYSAKLRAYISDIKSEPHTFPEQFEQLNIVPSLDMCCLIRIPRDAIPTYLKPVDVMSIPVLLGDNEDNSFDLQILLQLEQRADGMRVHPVTYEPFELCEIRPDTAILKKIRTAIANAQQPAPLPEASAPPLPAVAIEQPSSLCCNLSFLRSHYYRPDNITGFDDTNASFPDIDLSNYVKL